MQSLLYDRVNKTLFKPKTITGRAETRGAETTGLNITHFYLLYIEVGTVGGQ